MRFDGRLPRNEFCVWAFGSGGMFLCSVFIAILVFGLQPLLGGALGIAVIFGFGIAGLSLTVRRLHDLNFGGGWVIPVFVLPLAAVIGGFLFLSGDIAKAVIGGGGVILLFGALVLCCSRGQRGANTFGPDPLAERRSLQSIIDSTPEPSAEQAAEREAATRRKGPGSAANPLADLTASRRRTALLR